MFEITRKYIPNLTLEWRENYPILLGGGTNFGKKGYYKKLKGYSNRVFVVPGIGVPLMKTSKIKHRGWWKRILRGKTAKVRGPLSKRKLEINKIKAHVVGDLGFLADAPEPLFPNSKVIGINVGTAKNRLFGWNERRFYDNLFNALKKLRSGFSFHFFSVWPEDDDICSEFGSYFNSPVHRVYTLSEFFNKIPNCDIVIGMKLHFIVFSATSGIPFLSLSYRPKCLDVLASLNMEEFSLKTDESMDQLPELAADIFINREHLRGKLKERISCFKTRLINDISVLRLDIDQWEPPIRRWHWSW